MLVVFKVDITNESGVISKDHPMTIKAGTEIEFDPVTARVEKLIKLGIAAAAEQKEEQQDPPQDPPGQEGDQDPQDPPADPGDDLDHLKAQADAFGIEYAPNIGAKTLKDRIQKHLEENADQE